MSKYKTTIGLEVHVRLKSKSKMFCACKNALELDSDANKNVCPICMGFPGALPSLNQEVVRLGLIGGIALGCEINKKSFFDRKTYFYPDNPSSYQITQMYYPIVGKGSVKVLIDKKEKYFSLHHMHLENDAGKLIHIGGKTLLDFNRAGSPLMEIVTDPIFHSGEEVMEFLKELQKIFRFFGVSDADMEKGQMRCDVNISVSLQGSEKLGTRTETKNINSFQAIGRVIKAESRRQINILESFGEIKQETRSWDDDKGVGSTQRSKEDAMDYRYFPDPDLLPLDLDDDFINDCRKIVGELPVDKRIRYLKQYNLSDDDARILSSDRDLSQYFEKLVYLTNDPKKSCSYITTILLSLLNENDKVLSDLKFDIGELALVIDLVNRNELSSTNSKEVINELFLNGGKTSFIVDSKNLRQKNNVEALQSIVNQVLAENSKQVSDYKSGNENIFSFFVGQCMKASKGQGNPKIFNELLKNNLSK